MTILWLISSFIGMTIFIGWVINKIWNHFKYQAEQGHQI